MFYPISALCTGGVAMAGGSCLWYRQSGRKNVIHVKIIRLNNKIHNKISEEPSEKMLKYYMKIKKKLGHS